jgi:predicted PurR-regulated permease PerM
MARLAQELPEKQGAITAKIDRLVASLHSEDEKGKKSLGTMISTIQKNIDKKIEEETAPEEKPLFGFGPIPVKIEQEKEVIPESLGTYLAMAAEPIGTFALAVVLVLFMLFKREDLRNRIVTLSGRANLAVTTKALDEAGQRIARYLLMQFIINVTYGLTFAIGLFFLGVEYAALWGVTAAVLRYIPYLGPWIAGSLPVLYSLLTSAGWGQPLGAVALVIVLELLSNNVMEPLLYGRGVGVSEVAVILSAVFWGWLWGPIGLVLATPLTACLVVAGRYVPAMSIFHRVLSDVSEVEPHVVYYQRLLARDEEEAEELLDERVAATSLIDACSDVVVPALSSIKRDRLRALIDAEQEHSILECIGEHLEDLPQPPSESPSEPADVLPLVFGYAVRDSEDEAALIILKKLLPAEVCRFEILSRDMLVSEVVERIRDRKPAGLCLVGLPPAGLTHALSICKRLRSHFPDLTIAFGRWGRSFPEKHRAALRELGATYLGQTPTETIENLRSLARLQPATERVPTVAVEPVAGAV